MSHCGHFSSRWVRRSTDPARLRLWRRAAVQSKASDQRLLSNIEQFIRPSVLAACKSVWPERILPCKIVKIMSRLPSGQYSFFHCERSEAIQKVGGINERWIALKDSDPLWAEAHVESYATALRSSQ